VACLAVFRAQEFRQRPIEDTHRSRVVRTFGSVRPVPPIRPSMAQPSNERRCHLFLVPPSPCPLCKSPRATRIGVVDDVGIFRCAECEGVFTIPRTERAGDTDHEAHEET
jgi:hypothetical protein